MTSPSEAKLHKFKDLLVLTKDGEWGPDAAFEDSVPMHIIRGTDFQDIRHGSLSKVPVKQIAKKNAHAKSLCTGDVILETAGGTKDQPTGRSVLLKEKLMAEAVYPVTCASFSRFLRFDPTLANSEYMYWWLQAAYKNGLLYEFHVQHTGVARFQYTSFATSTFLSLPSLNEQKIIAAILGTLDDKIEMNQRMNATLEAMARALFKSWFVDFDPVRAKMEGRQPFGMDSETASLFPSRLVPSELGDIPEGWSVGKLSDIAEISSGQRPEDRNDTKTQRTPYPLYGGAGIMAYTTRYLLDRNIILTGRVGTLGKLIRVSGKFWPSDNTLLILPNTPEDIDYTYFSMAGMDLLSLNRGSTQPLLTQTDLKKQILLLPDIKTLRAYSHYSNELFKQKDALFAENEKLEKIRDYLLPKLISGDIRIPDAEKMVELL